MQVGHSLGTYFRRRSMSCGRLWTLDYGGACIEKTVAYRKMNAAVGDKYTYELVKLFEQEGPSLYNGQHSLCLTVPCLHYLQRKFAALQETSDDPVPTQFANFQQLQDSLGRLISLKLISDRRFPLAPTATLNLAPFKALQTLILKKVPLQLVTGLQRLRGQLKTLVIQRCYVEGVDDVIVRCGADDSMSFAWTNLSELDLSHNTITQLGDSLQYLPALEKANFSNNRIKENMEGIRCVDSVTFLHLGFNQLQHMPQFGSRAKYNLITLNLRNNCLKSVDGLEELDSLVELDLTDNLLSKHSALQPLKNLHHLNMLVVVGNPLVFHHKHRLKTAANLSNLVDQSMFRLDGKKLSSAEKKAIPRSLTHYSTVPLPSSSHPPLTDSITVPVGNERGEGNNSSAPPLFGSLTTSPQNETLIGKKLRKKSRTVVISDSEEEKHKTSVASSVPLIHARQLEHQEQLRKQLQENWLLSTNSVDTSSTTTDDPSGTMGRSASHPPPTVDNKPPSSVERKRSTTTSSIEHKGSGPGRQRRHSQPERKWSIGSGGGKKGRGKERENEGPMHSTPVERASTPSSVNGECFLVERYESDVEEEGEAELVFLSLTNRFLEERNTQGEILDRLALHCLQTASVEHHRRKGEESDQSEVLVLQFSYERRDRRKREYVLTEKGDAQMLLELLKPTVETNQATLLVGNRVECLKCQHVFDPTQALEQPSDEPQPLSKSFSSRRRSLSKLLCPYCKSPFLQYSTTKSFKSGSSSWHSPKATTVSESLTTVVAPKGKIQSGFSVDSDNMSPSSLTVEMSNSVQAPSSSANSISNSHTSSKRSPHSGNSDDPSTGEHHSSERYKVNQLYYQENEQDLPDGTSFLGYAGPQWPGGNQSPEDFPYPFDRVDLENSTTSLPLRKETRNAGQSDASSRLTNSEPTASTHNVVRNVKRRSSSSVTVDDRSPVLEDKPWISRKNPRPLNPFDEQYQHNKIISERYDRESVPENHSQMSTYTFQVAEERYGAAAVLGKWQKEFGDQGMERSSTTKAKSIAETLEERYGDIPSRTVNRPTEMDLGERIMEQQFSVGKPQLECIDEHEDMYTDRYSMAFADTSRVEALDLSPTAIERSQPSSRTSGKSSGAQLHRRYYETHDEREVEGGREREQWGGQESGRSTSTHSPYGSTNPFDSELDLLMEGEENGERRGEWKMQVGKGGGDRKPSRKMDAASNAYDDLCLQMPEITVSTSMPPDMEAGSYMRQAREKERRRERDANRQTLTSKPENMGHNRSKSMDYHPVKSNKVFGNQPEFRQHDPYKTKPPLHPASKKSSLESRSPKVQSRRSSLKSSACSIDSCGSSHASKFDMEPGYSSGEKQRKSQHSHSSSEKLAKGYNSGEIERHSRRGYNSLTSDKLSRGYSSGERERYIKGGYGSSEKLAKGYSSGERDRHLRGGYNSSGKGYSSGEKMPAFVSNHKPSGGSERHLSSGSGSGGGGRRISSDGEKKNSDTLKRSASLKSSSGSTGRKVLSSSLLFRDEDPSYVHNSFNLYLDMEVFNTDMGEHFKMAFKSPVVRYGHPEEISSLVVISNLYAHIYHITAPESHHPNKWLQPMATHPLEKLVYIDIGFGYQYLRMEFRLPGACYSFLMRDEDKCTICSSTLAFVVSDTPGCTFRTVGVFPFSVNSLQHPDRCLRECYLNHYEKISGRKTPIHSHDQGEGSEETGDKVTLYLLAHRFLSRNGQGQIPVTVVLTESNIYLACENFHQWPLPRLQELPPRETLEPPFSDVHCKDISDIEQIILDRDQSSQCVLKFFKENVSEGESRHWILIFNSAACIKKLISNIQKPWEAQFETPFPIHYD